MKKSSISRARYLACIAVMSAISTILMYLDFSLPIMPVFIKLDISELPALISSFALGPMSGVIVCLIKNLFNLIGTSTGGVGELSNFMLGSIFVLTAGFIYKYKKNRWGALIGAIVGSIFMASLSMLTNYYITYPVYTKFMPMEVIIGMYRAIYSGADTLWKCLAIFNLPFTFFKGMLVSILTFIVYKPLSRIIKGYSHNSKNAIAIIVDTNKDIDDNK